MVYQLAARFEGCGCGWLVSSCEVFELVVISLLLLVVCWSRAWLVDVIEGLVICRLQLLVLMLNTNYTGIVILWFLVGY